MFSSLRNKAWAATLAVGGLLLIGTAARADDAKSQSGDHRREAKSGGPSARSKDRGREDSSAGSRESGHGRTHAAGGQHGSREGKFAHTSHESSRGHWGGGHWAHSGATAVARQPMMGQKRVSSHTPATRAPVGTGAEATGLIAGATAVASHLTIMLACIGNMDEAASIGETTLGQATAGASIPRAGDITARVDTTQRATGEASIIDTHTMGRAHIVIPEQPCVGHCPLWRGFTGTNPSGFGPSGASSVAPAGLRRSIDRR